MNNNIKYGLKLFVFGIGIILFCVGWGLNYSLVMLPLSSFYDVGYIDEMTFNFGLYGIPAIGISVLVLFVLFVAFKMDSPKKLEIK